MKVAIIKYILAAFLAWGFALAARAQELKCDICGEPIGQQVFYGEDHVTGEMRKVCPACAHLEERCFLCQMPVREGYKKLADGRFLCARDARDAIESESEAKDICVDVRDDLNRLFSRFITFPGDTVVVSMVDKPHLGMNLPESDYTNSCASVFGTTASRVFSDGKFAHSIQLLSHLRKPTLMAVCAHECTHTWMNENLSPQRRQAIDRDTMEAFCELVAYKFMESRGETQEMKNIRRNAYTKGQIDVLIEADRRFGFNMVAEWVKSGDDAKLDLADLDRIRAVGADTPAPAKAVEWVVPPQAPPPPGPETLLLKGISGRVGHRFALINNATFEAQQRAKVRVGVTNVSVVCLEIREKSVVVQVNGEKQELFLRAN